MSKVDWSLAPEGAEFYSPPFRGLHACWYKDVDGEVYLWCESEPYWSQREEMIGELIERPKPWSGPEDGLPPVGTVCEHSADSNEGDSQDGEWFRVEVVAHHRFQEDDYVCAVWVRDAQISYSSAGYHFRALKTPDQQAAEKRETAIRELMDIAQVDCRVTAARLVDAGFKREVV